MANQDALKEFKKEFSEEIEDVNVTIDDLKKNKFSANILQAEAKLHKIFGDEIYVPKKIEEKIEGEKEIIKLSEEDIAFDSHVRDICENLVDDDFDSKMGVILNKYINEEN